MNPASFLCGNRNGHHNMELKTKKISNTDTTKHQGSTRLLVKGMLHVSTKPGEREWSCICVFGVSILSLCLRLS
jgi:hypothetical protein